MELSRENRIIALKELVNKPDSCFAEKGYELKGPIPTPRPIPNLNLILIKASTFYETSFKAANSRSEVRATCQMQVNGPGESEVPKDSPAARAKLWACMLKSGRHEWQIGSQIFGVPCSQIDFYLQSD